MRLFAVLILSALSINSRTWNDTTRDVYVDGKLDRNAQVLVTSDTPRLLAVLCGDEVLVFDPDNKQVSRTDRSQFTLGADKTTATSKELTAAPAGTFVKPDPATYLATAGDKSLLLAAHQSQAGPMTVEELWTTVPVWRAIFDAYEPDEAVVAQLKAIDQPTRIDVVLATWCGDSKKHVPRLLKAVGRANNPNLQISLIGVGPDFESPMEYVQRENVTNVPTVIVRRDGYEVGRYVETPAGKTVESDLADIVLARQQPHPGRSDRGAKIAEGTYLLRDARKRREGTEQWELYERTTGGFVVHSVIAKRGGARTETWATLDKDRKPRSAEITHREHGKTTRSRYRYDAGQWSAVSRGGAGGVLSQVVAAPETLALLTPATISYAWAGREALVVPAHGLGAIVPVTARVEMDARRQVPKLVRLADGSERRLVQ